MFPLHPPLPPNPHYLYPRIHPPTYPPTGYIGEFEIVDDHRGGKIVIDLIGRINKVGVLSPRFDVKYGEYENWVNNVLPSRQVRPSLFSFFRSLLLLLYGWMALCFS